MKELVNARVVEVDQPAMVAAKREATRGLGTHVECVPIDFETERLEDRVEVRSKAFFIWEGVTQYLRRAAVDEVLRFVARAPRGSELVFTYLPLEVIEGRSTLFGAAAAKSASKGAPWITGFDPALLGQELHGLGLELCEDSGAAEHRARYLAPIGRTDRAHCPRAGALTGAFRSESRRGRRRRRGWPACRSTPRRPHPLPRGRRPRGARRRSWTWPVASDGSHGR